MIFCLLYIQFCLLADLKYFDSSLSSFHFASCLKPWLIQLIMQLCVRPSCFGLDKKTKTNSCKKWDNAGVLLENTCVDLLSDITRDDKYFVTTTKKGWKLLEKKHLLPSTNSPASDASSFILKSGRNWIARTLTRNTFLRSVVWPFFKEGASTKISGWCVSKVTLQWCSSCKNKKTFLANAVVVSF